MKSAPESNTTAVDLPHANAESTESLQRKIEGASNRSNRNSVSLSLSSLLWIEFSVKSKGVSFTGSLKLLTSDAAKISSSTSKFTIMVK